MASRLLEANKITMPNDWFGNWLSLRDGDGRVLGRARNGHVHDADGLLVVRPARWRRGNTVLTGDGSLVGTMTRARTDDGRRPRNSYQLRIGDSDQAFADYTDGAVRLAGPEGREVATIVGIKRHLIATDWQLTFSACDNRQLRLMSLWLLGSLAVRSSGG